MLVNADFSKPAIVAGDDYQWVASPQPGVERVMLDRLGGEKARATSIVRYASRSCFPRHLHPGGEEIFVLSGTFSEDGNHYPAGFYLRNPPGSGHQPSSHEGAIIFVKLWQMQADESASIRVDTRTADAWRHDAGRAVCPLFENGHEQVRLERLPAGQTVFSNTDSAVELLVIEGQIDTPDRSLSQGSWMRLPAGLRPVITSGAEGATLFIKTGHFPARSSTPNHEKRKNSHRGCRIERPLCGLQASTDRHCRLPDIRSPAIIRWGGFSRCHPPR